MQVGNVYDNNDPMLLALIDDRHGRYFFLMFNPKGRVTELKLLWRKKVELMSPVATEVIIPHVHVARSFNAIRQISFEAGSVFTVDRDRLGLIVGRSKNLERFNFVTFKQDGDICEFHIDSKRENWQDSIEVGNGELDKIIV